MLELRSVSARYGQVQVLWDVSLTVGEGELVCLLGGNASGKSTTIKTIIGLVHPVAGEILWEGRPIQRRTPAEVVRAGIAPVLESRRIFPASGPTSIESCRCSPRSASGAVSLAGRCPAASSRCSPWAARSWPGRACW